ncbi:MAG: hypothetical protein ACFFAS_02630 [Promethearchaeota archaeon]
MLSNESTKKRISHLSDEELEGLFDSISRSLYREFCEYADDYIDGHLI